MTRGTLEALRRKHGKASRAPSDAPDCARVSRRIRQRSIQPTPAAPFGSEVMGATPLAFQTFSNSVACLAMTAVARKKARPAVTKVLKTQLKRTAARAAAALAAGRVPGKPGRARSVAGSKGGSNGARDADRAARRQAKRKGLRPKPAARASPTLVSTIVRKPAAGSSHGLDLLEVFCYKDSGLAHEWAKRGYSSVRVVLRRGTAPRAPPTPVRGRAMTWALDLHCEEDRKMLEAFARKHRPSHLWTSPECRPFTYVQRINKARKAKQNRRWRPRGEAIALDTLRWCRRLHSQQVRRGGHSHHEQSANSRAPFDGALKHAHNPLSL